MVGGLEAQWQELMRLLGVDPRDALQVNEKLAFYYGQSTRLFHDLGPVGDALDQVDALAHLPENPTAVKPAAWLRDVVDITRSKKNQERRADLAVIGASPEQDATYSQAICKACWCVPEDVYKKSRIEILISFLEWKRLYTIEILFDHYEDKARHNIATRIKELAP